MHPTPLNADYIRELIEKSARYRVDSFEICGQCHTPYGGLDGLIDYREFPHAYAQWDQRKVAENQEMMREILRSIVKTYYKLHPLYLKNTFYLAFILSHIKIKVNID